MKYFCSDETLIVRSAVNADKIRLVCNILNDSKYRETAQQFLTQKQIELNCKYSYAVSNPNNQKPAAYVFFATDKITKAYYIKVDAVNNAVSEWYITDDVALETPRWFSLNLLTDEYIEYYVINKNNSIYTEKKFDVKTNQELVTNYFQVFKDMTLEQQGLIKDLPFKETSVCWSNKPNGFTVEFLPSYADVYDNVSVSSDVVLAFIDTA